MYVKFSLNANFFNGTLQKKKRTILNPISLNQNIESLILR